MLYIYCLSYFAGCYCFVASGIGLTSDYFFHYFVLFFFFFFFSSRRRHTRCLSDWSSDVCSSDLVYALGAMLYEMVTGRLPFEGPTVMAILSKHLTETPEPPSVRRPDLGIPPALDALVMTSLVKEPAQRAPSIDRKSVV